MMNSGPLVESNSRPIDFQTATVAIPKNSSIPENDSSRIKHLINRLAETEETE